MTYSLNIDQEFAIINDLSLTQVSTLAAFMTLPIWSKTVAIDGFVWYRYSDEKMAEDFPLLFGVAKRCYKNISDLADMGFVKLTKLGREKYVRFTERCVDWNKGKDQNRTISPKTDFSQSENGLKNSPKTDFPNKDYNINNDNINNKAADGGLFPAEHQESKLRGTTEPAACLFINSRFANYDDFAAQFAAPDYNGIDVCYYYNAVKDWSAQKGKKMKDWIATARNFMRSDMEKNKLHRVAGSIQLEPEAQRYLQDMA